VPGDAEIEPPVVVDPAVIALPNCESYVTVNELAVHLPYRVISKLVVNVPLPAA
jgi:hypothetical protein